MKKALVTGITGQDGYFLTKLLLEKGYDVYGVVRRNSQNSIGNLQYLSKEELESVKICWGDITDNLFIDETIKNVQADEIYHLAAQSFVSFSFNNPRLTYDVNIGGTLNVANSVMNYSPHSRTYFAATSELYGKVQETLKRNNTILPKKSIWCLQTCRVLDNENYRESYDLFMSNGILFNHESEMRGPEFVTRKISLGVASIYHGLSENIELGNLDSKRDWGYAEDYVHAMWLMLQHENQTTSLLLQEKHIL